MKKIILSLLAVCTIVLTACAQHTQPKAEGGKVLVAYFSATGTTAHVASLLAKAAGGDLFAITPERPYTDADLDWRNDKSRSSVEMHNLSFRPALKEKKADMAKYDVVYIGFPIWWDLAPTIVNTFIEAHDLKGKKVIPFATSGGSTIDNSEQELRKAYPDLDWQEGRLLNGASESSLRQWVSQ